MNKRKKKELARQSLTRARKNLKMSKHQYTENIPLARELLSNQLVSPGTSSETLFVGGIFSFM
jgi:hypothetical protein